MTFRPIKLFGCDPQSWRKWVARGCDLMGYALGTPPDFRPHPSYEGGLKIIREAFAALPGAPLRVTGRTCA